MVYGRGAEEVRFCKKNKLNYEVIPGLTAGIAGSSLFSIPLTERNKCNMILFYAGKNGENGFPCIKTVKRVIDAGSPVIIYMGLRNLSQLAKDLMSGGLDEAVPLHILCRISQQTQETFTTALGEVEEFLESKRPDCPSTIIIGKNTGMI